jgi:hypothetical protein
MLDRPLELRGQRCHFLAPFLRPLLVRFAASNLHGLNFENVAPENLDCLDHPSDFVGALFQDESAQSVSMEGFGFILTLHLRCR